MSMTVLSVQSQSVPVLFQLITATASQPTDAPEVLVSRAGKLDAPLCEGRALEPLSSTTFLSTLQAVRGIGSPSHR